MYQIGSQAQIDVGWVDFFFGSIVNSLGLSTGSNPLPLISLETRSIWFGVNDSTHLFIAI